MRKSYFGQIIPGNDEGIQNYTPARSALTPAGLIGPNSQVLGHRTIPF